MLALCNGTQHACADLNFSTENSAIEQYTKWHCGISVDVTKQINFPSSVSCHPAWRSVYLTHLQPPGSSTLLQEPENLEHHPSTPSQWSVLILLPGSDHLEQTPCFYPSCCLISFTSPSKTLFFTNHFFRPISLTHTHAMMVCVCVCVCTHMCVGWCSVAWCACVWAFAYLSLKYTYTCVK